MVEVTKVTVDNEDYLKIKMVRFDKDITQAIMSIQGWFKAREPLTFGLPFSKLEEFHAKTHNYMVVWKAEGDSMGALVSGIDTSNVPVDYVVPYKPKIPLRPHQIQSFNLLLQMDSLLIADQEGVGNITLSC